MSKITLLVGALLLAGGVFAQEAVVEDEAPAAPVKSIRVLEHPYDIALFYRSPERPYFYPVYPGLDPAYGGYAAPADPRYPIAGAYRQGFAGRYGAFWASGYRGGFLPYVGAGRRGGFHRRIGQNGDLFLMAPTFLAPVGPLSQAFFDGR